MRDGAGGADRVAEQLERGGLLLRVRTRDAAHEDRAMQILQHSDADDVPLHDLAAAKELGRQTAARLQKLVDEADRESFPASDAPSFSPSVSGGPKRSP